MGMFSDLMGKIFKSGADAERPADAAPPRTGGGPFPIPRPAGGVTSSNSSSSVDVAAVLDRLAANNKEKLDWKHSIVDMMKLVGMDSSLASRKDLAKDLNYSGDMNDSAEMNMWLHKEVLKKLAANGGNVPADLLNR
ncbi:MAG TPA: DUF3597 domain-containing protein [Thermoanaerobaculia bacterium]|nr:DUF3597 domain-containing protein [Thermoanaerobaculia bacterium]